MLSRLRSRIREGGSAALESVLPALMPPPPAPLPEVPNGVGLGLGVPAVTDKSPSTSEDLFKGIAVMRTARVVKVEVVDSGGW